MKLRCFALLSFLYFMSGITYGQGLSGKWETNLAAASQATGGLPAEGTANRAVVLDLTVDADNKISGSVREIGSADPINITSGTLTGWTFTFRTSRKLNGNTVNENWNGVITDDNTLRVTRERAPRSVGVGPRRGPGVGIVPVDPGPRVRATAADGDLIFHRPQATQPKPYSGIK